jgi:hypothetical protein
VRCLSVGLLDCWIVACIIWLKSRVKNTRYSSSSMAIFKATSSPFICRMSHFIATTYTLEGGQVTVPGDSFFCEMYSG